MQWRSCPCYFIVKLQVYSDKKREHEYNTLVNFELKSNFLETKHLFIYMLQYFPLWGFASSWIHQLNTVFLIFLFMSFSFLIMILIASIIFDEYKLSYFGGFKLSVKQNNHLSYVARKSLEVTTTALQELKCWNLFQKVISDFQDLCHIPCHSKL